MTSSFITRAEVNSQFSTIVALNAESTARTIADGNLQVNVNSVSASVTGVVANLTTVTANIINEIITRVALSTSLTNEIARASAAEAILTTNLAITNTNLNNEITTRVALSTSLTNEIARSSAAENALAANIIGLNSTSNGAACSGSTPSTAAATTTPEYWMDSSVANNETIGTTIVTANRNVYTLKILGVGFSTYYNPQFQVSFLCNFYNPAFGNKTTFGVVVYDPLASFLLSHVECPVPVIAMALPVTISLYKSTGQLYPFGGFSGANILTVQYYWTSVAPTSVALGNAITVTGLGFNVLTSPKYKCLFTGKNSTNGVIAISYISLGASNVSTLACGVTPAGFAVNSGTSTVNLTIFEANADNSTGYQVQPTGSAAITYSTCMDGAKDGDETDIDCGGLLCGLICTIGKNCLVNTDCLNYCAGGVCIASSVIFFLFDTHMYVYYNIYMYNIYVCVCA